MVQQAYRSLSKYYIIGDSEMYVNFKGKTAQLYNDNKQIIRQFRANADIVNAQVQGTGKDAVVALTVKNGKTILYKATGQIIRR